MSGQSILIIEDDVDIAQLVQSELREAGFEPVVAPTAMRGLALARELNPAVVILDLGLPDFNGAEVVLRLRRTHDMPIVVLFGDDAVRRKIELMSAGVSDYLVKPFSAAELVARLHVQLRRQVSGRAYFLNGLEVNVPRRECRFQESDISLTPREFDLLHCFMRSPGRVFSRADLVSAVWQGSLPESSNVIEVHMANLRTKMRAAGAYGFLRTVRGAGYGLRQEAGAATV